MKVDAVRLLDFMSKGGHPLSASLHDQFTRWLLPGAAPSAGAARRGGAATLPATQARLLLRAWVGLAVAPGSPARATLPALVQALDPRLRGAEQLGAAGVVQRAVDARLEAAGRLKAAGACVSDTLSVHDAAGEFFNRLHVISVLRRLARLCALVTRNRLLACMHARAPAPRVRDCVRSASAPHPQGAVRAAPALMPPLWAGTSRARTPLVASPSPSASASAPWYPRFRARSAATCRR